MAEEETPVLKPKNTPVSAFDLFPKSAKLVQNNIGVFAILYLIPFLSSLGYLRNGFHSSGFSGIGNVSGLPGYAFGALASFGVLLFALVFFVSLIVQSMTYGLSLESSRGKKPALDDLWVYAKKFWWRLFLMNVFIGILTILGLILLIIPGLIVIRRNFLAPYLMLDKDLSITEAMRQSAALSKPHSGSIWGIIGVMILLSLPGVIPVIGWIFSFLLSMFYSVAPALRYQELKKLH